MPPGAGTNRKKRAAETALLDFRDQGLAADRLVFVIVGDGRHNAHQDAGRQTANHQAGGADRCQPPSRC